MQKFSAISIVTASLIGLAIITSSLEDPCSVSGKVTGKNSTEIIPSLWALLLKCGFKNNFSSVTKVAVQKKTTPHLCAIK